MVARTLFLAWCLCLWPATVCQADSVPLTFQVQPGGATLQDRDTGQAVAVAPPGAMGRFTFSVEPGVHHCRIERSNFDDLDVMLTSQPDGRWLYQSAFHHGWLDDQTLLMMSCRVRLAVKPADTRVYVDSDAPNVFDTSPTASLDVDVGGLRRHVSPLLWVDGRVRIPHAWNPPLLYLVHPGFETRMLQIPAGALDGPPDGIYPLTPVELRPLYGPFSYPAFDVSLLVAVGLSGLWIAPRLRGHLQLQADKNALLDDILSSRQPSDTGIRPASGLTQHTVCTDTGVRYLLLNKLGQGAMGAVYEAVPVAPGERQHVAVKVLSTQAWSQAEMRERFRREVRICESLQHPAIVKVMDWGVWEADSGTAPFMIMELVEGRTLRAVMDESARLPPLQVVEWLLDCLHGLKVAHQAGVIHRDVKPENLMVTPRNRIKIMDFGIARMLGGDVLTATGGQLGTPAYMSIEHMQARSVVPSSDLYSLGVVGYEMLVGARPFNEPDIFALLGRMLTESPPHVRDTRPEVSVDLDHVIWTMLAVDPEHRYADCDTVIQALLSNRSEQTTLA